MYLYSLGRQIHRKYNAGGYISCYDGGVVSDDAQLVHVALGPGDHAENTDGDLVSVLPQAEKDVVAGVRRQRGDGVGVHLVAHLHHQLSLSHLNTSNLSQIIPITERNILRSDHWQ